MMRDHADSLLSLHSKRSVAALGGERECDLQQLGRPRRLADQAGDFVDPAWRDEKNLRRPLARATLKREELTILQSSRVTIWPLAELRERIDICLDLRRCLKSQLFGGGLHARVLCAEHFGGIDQRR